MKSQKFKTKLFLAGKTATGIEVPEKIVESFGRGKKVPVTVTINTYSYPSTIVFYNGVYMLPVSAAVREGAGIEAGETIEVELVPDDSVRTVELPADFSKALNKNTAAKNFFETLSNSGKKFFTIPIDQAKTPETRLRRIEKAIEQLAANKKP
ncbi:YdeI/OmpD-associated family protein [Pollutibacter soli]|uniref:YdeI/OmpD-associated family protein n=1 Tax=Pollutibacter soli TaxID=3034157 RepID=UPI0030132C80